MKIYRNGKSIAVIALLAVGMSITLSTASAIAGPGRGRYGKRSGFGGGMNGIGIHMRELCREVGVTDGQRSEIRAIMQSNKTEALEVAKSTAEKRRDLNKAAREVGDEATVRAAAIELGIAMGDAALVKARIFNEVMNILTPEQRIKVTGLISEKEAAIDERLKRMSESQ